MSERAFTDVLERLKSARHPLVVPDLRVDGDSVGSASAILDFFARDGKKVWAYISEALPERYRFLPHADRMTTEGYVLQDHEIDLVIFLDCSDGAYAEKVLARIPGHPVVVNIDHHATNPRYGTIPLVDVGAPATAELVYKLLSQDPRPLTREMVTALLTGITFDTTALSNGATNARALHTVSELSHMGGKPHQVAGKLLRNRRVQALRVWGKALERLRSYPEHALFVTHLTREDLSKEAVTDDEVYELKNYLGLVVDTDMVCVLKEQMDGGVGLSFRSVKRDVAAIAQRFGGGGHIRSAGCTMPKASLAEAETALLAALSSPMQ